MISIFLTICLNLITASSAENGYPIIGIVAQELTPTLQELYPAYSSFIAASYVKAAESSATRVVPIVINRNESYYRNILESVNGIILPGGSSLFGLGHAYFDAVNIIYNISKEINDRGTTFPILSVCLGYEFLISVANDDEDILRRCDINYENLPLEFTLPYDETKLFSRLTDKEFLILNTSDVTVNHHRWCAFENDFKNSSLKDEWLVTSLSTAANGVKFIATVEHRKYPFFGLQFHPEKIAFEWNRKNHFPHSSDALKANRYFYETLAYYSKKNKNRFKNSSSEKRSLIYNYAPIVPENYQYEQLYLF